MFYRRITTIVSAVLILAASAVVSGTEYAANRMMQAPVIDGKTDDAGWKNMPWACGFRNLYEKWSFSSKQTTFKIGYDQKFLYLAIRCFEPEMAKLKTGSHVIDGWPAMLDDVYFIYSNEYKEDGTWEDSPFKILQLGAGGIHRIHGFKGEAPAPLEMKTAYHADDRNWYLESAVPLKFLGIDPGKGGFFNIVRHLQTVSGSRNNRTSSWTEVTNSKLDQHTLEPLRFSQLKRAVHLDKPGNELTAGGTVKYGWWLNKKLSKMIEGGDEFAEAKSRFSNSPNWSLAEKAREVIGERLKKYLSYDLGVLAKSDAYLDWLYALSQMADTSDPVRLEVRLHDATAKIFVNGMEVKIDNGVCGLLFADGVNTVAVEAKASGSAPGVSLKLPDFQETDGRWMILPSASGDWQLPDFDDRKWMSPSLRDGFMWGETKDGTICFRQTLLWSRNFYGGSQSAVVPPHSEYGFSPGTTEVFQLAIFSPIVQPMESFKCQIEIPEGFRLLDTKCQLRRDYCWYPDIVTSKKIRITGKNYIQYDLKYDISKLKDTCVSLLPVKHDNYDKAKGAAEFRFRRLINGNITELTTVLTVDILPPVNGRSMKKILYPQYDHQCERSVSDELLSELVRNGVASGMDEWMCVPKWGYSAPMEERRVKTIKTILEGGGRVIAGFPGHMPLWGTPPKTQLYKLVKENPEYQAVYFNSSGPRIKDWSLDFCFTYALGEGRERFADALRKDYQEWKDSIPGAEYVFLNNEAYPWEFHGSNIKPGEHCYCFCDRCTAAFRQFAGLPADRGLTDREIFDKYREKWAEFWRSNQSGRLMELVTKTAHDVGLKTIFYHNNGDKYAWQTVAGKADRYCVGLPGGSFFVDRDSQKVLDDAMAFYSSVGIKQFIGQRRTYFPFRSGKEGRSRTVFSKNGYALDPRAIKTETVRMAATTRGGVTYESVMQLTGGSLYYFGEATRLIAAYEELFYDGKRKDELADAGSFKYPDILVLCKGDERLVLIFNETNETKNLTLNNHNLKPGQHAEIFEKPGKISNPQTMDVSVPSQDVVAVLVK